MFLLGCLVTIVLGIAANLLTPGLKPLWATVVSWSRRGLEASIRQKLNVLQFQLDQLNRLKASNKDLYLYFFRWLLGIIAFLVASFACALLAIVGMITPEARVELTTASLVFLIFALVSCVVVLGMCGDYTVAGMGKKTAELEANIAKLTATLPESRSN